MNSLGNIDGCNLAVSKQADRLSSFRCILGDVLFISDVANGIATSPCFVLQTLIRYCNMGHTVTSYLFEENVYYY